MSVAIHRAARSYRVQMLPLFKRQVAVQRPISLQHPGWAALMIIEKKHLEDQACKTGGKYYGHNIPFPADHSGKCNEADEDGEPIDRSRAWKDYVQAEPDGQI